MSWYLIETIREMEEDLDKTNPGWRSQPPDPMKKYKPGQRLSVQWMMEHHGHDSDMPWYTNFHDKFENNAQLTVWHNMIEPWDNDPAFTLRNKLRKHFPEL